MASTPQHSHHRSGFIEHTAESVGQEFNMQGILYVLGFWTGGWRRRNVHLRHNCLNMTLMKQGFIKRTFALDAQTVCEDNSTRPFCFTLTKASGEKCFLAAENISAKETWMETIQANLSLLRLIGRKVRTDDHNRALNEYISRPILYIKVIRAKNLLAKDSNNHSDPYVKITVGSSTVKTTTRKKDLNPEWGMVFSFAG
ncbi:hypothetical protein EON65_57425 [archaeon]|nr:MAG: hypothetical protein EON65_57425 [archaeon]